MSIAVVYDSRLVLWYSVAEMSKSFYKFHCSPTRDVTALDKDGNVIGYWDDDLQRGYVADNFVEADIYKHISGAILRYELTRIEFQDGSSINVRYFR